MTNRDEISANCSGARRWERWYRGDQWELKEFVLKGEEAPCPLPAEGTAQRQTPDNSINTLLALVLLNCLVKSAPNMKNKDQINARRFSPIKNKPIRLKRQELYTKYLSCPIQGTHIAQPHHFLENDPRSKNDMVKTPTFLLETVLPRSARRGAAPLSPSPSPAQPQPHPAPSCPSPILPHPAPALRGCPGRALGRTCTADGGREGGQGGRSPGAPAPLLPPPGARGY